ELVHVMRVGMARWAVVDESVLGVIEKVTTMLPNTLREIWVIGSSSKSHPSFYSLMKTERWAAWPPQVENSSFNPAREVALMQFSSGTTGLTKGVMLSHRNLLTLYMQVKCFVEDVDNKKKASGEPDSEADILSRVLLFIPLHHNYATVTFNFVVTVGGCCVMMKTFSPHSFFNALQKYKITYAPIVPHIANFLLHTPLLKEYDITSLKSLISASAPLPPSTKQALTTRIDSPYHVLSFYDLSPSVIQQQKLRRAESVRGLYCAHSLTAATSFEYEYVSPDGATVGVLLDETEAQVCMVDDLLIPWLQRTPREGTPTGCPPSVTSWC
ncbi:hypothetical protein O3P69_008776, partial [Scylla paramamosain]